MHTPIPAESAISGHTEAFALSGSWTLPQPSCAPTATPDIALTKKGEAYVAAVLAAADDVFFLTVDKNDRQSISTSIERLINMLDDLEPDPDLEPDADGEPSLGWVRHGSGTAGLDPRLALSDLELDTADQESTATERHGMGFVASAPDDSEDTHDAEWVNEDGGDINDEYHDGDGDREPSMGWAETFGQGPKVGVDISMGDVEGDPTDDGPSALRFDGSGSLAAVDVLRNLRRMRPDVPQNYIPGSCSWGERGLDVDQLTILRGGVAMVGAFTFAAPINHRVTIVSPARILTNGQAYRHVSDVPHTISEREATP